MSEDTYKTGDENSDQSIDDEQVILDDLKNRANTLGISFHPSIGIDKLREKISKALEDPEPETAKPQLSAKKLASIEARKKAMRLVRVEIACMDPLKKDYDADIFEVSNSTVGRIKMCIPFNVPWHVPHMMLNMLREKRYLQIMTKRMPNGQPYHEKKYARTYAIHELDPLTPEEIKDLAQRQAMAAGKDEQGNVARAA